VTVAELLAASRTCHQRYRQHAGRISAHGAVASHPDVWMASAQVREALRLRTEAHALDECHMDDAWIEDRQAMKGQTSDQLIAFYVKYLAPEALPVASSTSSTFQA
jgi:hypothetical protein